LDLIVTHTNADFDALASIVAARKLYPESRLMFPGSQEAVLREFMKLGRHTVRIESEKKCSLEGIDRLIIVDTRLASRIGKAAQLLGKVTTHIYDHHPRTPEDVKGDKDVGRESGATVTILIGLLKKKRIKITPLEATIMALGIYEDTGSLTFGSTTKEDVLALAWLLGCGANLNIVSNYLHKPLTEEELSLLTLLIQRTTTRYINGVKVALTACEVEEYVGNLSALVHKLLEIENFNLIFVLAGYKNKVQLVARSRLKFVNVGSIAAHFGGGGHTRAASAVIKGKTLREAKSELLKLLRKEIKPLAKARDIMTEVICPLSPRAGLAEAKKVMLRLNLSSSPVVAKGKLSGIITRGDIDKAIHHGLGSSAIGKYMSTQPITIGPGEPLHRIEEIIFEKDIESLPVVTNKKLLGIIRRADVLRFLYSQKSEETETVKTTKNLREKLESSMPAGILETLRWVGRAADREGKGAFVVGGLVRDLLIGVKNYDLDIVIEGDAIRFSRKLAAEKGGKLISHKKFGTATIIMRGGAKIDFASARIEYYERPAALPEVTLSTLKSDLSRRDFTINAMAVRINQKDFGELVDFFGGEEDLKRKKIRVLHNLSLVEDPTRIFRAVRFEQRFNFKIDKATQHLIKTAVSLEMFEKVHPQRVREEIVLILSEPQPLKSIMRMFALHELRFLHPNLKLNKQLTELFKSIEEVLTWFKLSFFEREKLTPYLIYLTALCDPLTPEEALAVYKRFMFSNKEVSAVGLSKTRVPEILKLLGQKRALKASEVYCALRGLSTELLLFALAKARPQKVKKQITLHLTDYRNVKLKLGGKELRALGIKPGPQFKKILQETLYAKLDGKVKTKGEELSFIKKRYAHLLG